MKKYQKETPQWTQRLFRTVYKCWNYHSPCTAINFQAWEEDNTGNWQIKVAPVFQELYGGEEDGKKVWAGFVFDMGQFSREKGVWIEHHAVASPCVDCENKYPKLMAKGKFENHDIFLEVYLEPVENTEPVEIIDTITNEIKEVPEDE